MFDKEGLYLRLDGAGGGLWRMRFRWEGKERTASFGPYPSVSLKAARARAEEFRVNLRNGVNPILQKKAATAARVGARTFGEVAREVLDRDRDAAAASTQEKREWLLTLLRPLHGKSVAELKPADVLAVLERIEGAGRWRRRTEKMLAGRVFDYAVQRELRESNPLGVLRGALKAVKVKHHTAVTDPREFGELLCAINAYEGKSHSMLASALKLLPLVFVRSAELRFATWAEIDLKAAVWRIPAERMKMGTAHSVPLSTQALAILSFCQVLSGPDGLIFPGRDQKPISDTALRKALKRIGFGPERMSIHGFRRTASTLLNELDVHPDLIELQLAHKARGVRAVYNAAEKLPQRTAMLQQWADYLDRLKAAAAVA